MAPLVHAERSERGGSAATRLPSGTFFGEPVREVESDGLRLTLSRYDTSDPQPWHTHENPTYFFLLKGDLADRCRRVEAVPEPFTLIYHPTDEPHISEVGPKGMVGLNIETSRDWLERNELTARDLGPYALLNGATTRLAALRMLVNVFGLPDEPAVSLDTCALEMIAEQSPARFGPKESKVARWLKEAEAYLRDSLGRTISLRDVAAHVGVHPVYLARVFRAHYHCTVGDFILRLRLLNASRYALETDCKLTEAAHEAGFADQSHFVRIFSRETGLTPKVLLRLRKLA